MTVDRELQIDLSSTLVLCADVGVANMLSVLSSETPQLVIFTFGGM